MATIAGALLIAVAVFAGARGVRRLARRLREAHSLEVLRGIRDCVLAAAAGIFALGALTSHRGLVVLGAVFLAEELYEIAVVSAAVRWGERRASDGSA